MRKYYVLLLLPLFLAPAAAVAEEATTEEVKRGWLGVYPEDLSEAMAIALDLDCGVLIEGVVDDSPAGESGFQKGDVVVELDGVKMEDAATLRHTIRDRPAKRVDVHVRRRGKPVTLPVTLGERESGMAMIEEHDWREIPEDAIRLATKALQKVGPEMQRVKVRVLEDEELKDELEELRDELEDLKEELEEELEELREDIEQRIEKD
jgi:membrane-associated protease RseP (regulator of RpoE activity)